MPRSGGMTLGDKMTMNQAPGGPGWDPPPTGSGDFSPGANVSPCWEAAQGTQRAWWEPVAHNAGVVPRVGRWAALGRALVAVETEPPLSPLPFVRPVFSALCCYRRTPQLCSTSLENEVSILPCPWGLSDVARRW